MRFMTRALARFRDDRRGTMIVEFVLIMPILMWSYLALYTFWDAYRAANMAQKAAYTVSDMLSREQQTINSAYINGMRTMLDYLIADQGDGVELRVTSVMWSELNKRFDVEWSRTSGTTKTGWTTAALNANVADKIPAMGDGETVVIVETWLDYTPPLNIGLEETTFQEFVVTRPRFAPRIVYQ